MANKNFFNNIQDGDLQNLTPTKAQEEVKKEVEELTLEPENKPSLNGKNDIFNRLASEMDNKIEEEFKEKIEDKPSIKMEENNEEERPVRRRPGPKPGRRPGPKPRNVIEEAAKESVNEEVVKPGPKPKNIEEEKPMEEPLDVKEIMESKEEYVGKHEKADPPIHNNIFHVPKYEDLNPDEVPSFLKEDGKNERQEPPIIGLKPVDKDENSKEKTEEIAKESIFAKEEVKEMSGGMDNIVKFVCIKIVENIAANFNSKIYTKEYMSKLSDKYMQGEIKLNNPMMKMLLDECKTEGYQDAYFGSITEKILDYMLEQ